MKKLYLFLPPLFLLLTDPSAAMHIRGNGKVLEHREETHVQMPRSELYDTNKAQQQQYAQNKNIKNHAHKNN